MHVDALDALLDLRADEGGLGGDRRQLALGDEAQIGAADFELRLHDFECAAAVGERLPQDLFAVARGELGGERPLDLVERLQADGRVSRDRLFLFRRADLDLCLQRPPFVDRRQQVRAEVPDRVVATLQDKEIARDRTHARGEADDREPRGLRFADPVERGGDPSFGRDDIGSPLEELRGEPSGHAGGLRGQLC